MSINLLYIEDTSKKLRCILGSYKIRSTFCTKITLQRLICKLTNRVVPEDKNNIVYKIDSINCEAVYFGESKQSLDEPKRSVKNCD